MLNKQIRRERDLLIVAASGVGTLAAIQDLRSFVAGCLAQQDARAVVVDMRDVAVVLSERDWERLDDPSNNPGIGPPIAMVVVPRQEGAFESYCYRLAAHGRFAMVYAEMQPAIAWASVRQEHWKNEPDLL